MNPTEYPAACLSVGSGCAIERRTNDAFRALFTPSPPVPERNQEQAHSSGAGTSSQEDSK